jgi:hypothetical protein
VADRKATPHVFSPTSTAWTRPRPVLISPLFGWAPGRGPSQAFSGKAVESAAPACSRRPPPKNPGKGPSVLGPFFREGRCGGRSSVATMYICHTDPLSPQEPLHSSSSPVSTHQTLWGKKNHLCKKESSKCKYESGRVDGTCEETNVFWSISTPIHEIDSNQYVLKSV